MRIETEGKDFAILALSTEEASHLAADILSQGAVAGDRAVAVAQKLKEAGLCHELVVSRRMEWAGPDDDHI